MGYFSELWTSIFTQGVTPVQEKTLNFAFVALIIINFVLLYVTKSIHFVVLQILTICLWRGIAWFIGEYKVALANQKAEEAKKEGEKAADESTESEPVEKSAEKSAEKPEKPEKAEKADKPVEKAVNPAETSAVESKSPKPTQRKKSNKRKV